MSNSPRYIGFLDPPYNVTLTDDSGAAINLTGCTSSSFTLTMLNQSTALSQQGVGVWTITNAVAGQASYQWTTNDLATAGPWMVYTTVHLPSESSPREFDPELILVLPGTVGAGAAPPGVLPAPAAAPLYVNVRDYGALPSNAASINMTAITAAWAALKAAGAGVLYFPGPGAYQTADLLFQSFSNFVLKGDRGASITGSPNTAASPGQATHDVCIIADCTDFSVDGLTFDGQRDTIAGDQFLTANAASGQKNVTVQNGTKYVVGQAVSVFGGLTANGGTEKTFNDSNLTISSIAGNVLTLSANLTHSYTGTGASGGAYLTQYQTGGVVAYSIAGRALGNEDAQNGLHLLNCQRFVIRNCVAQNTWESPIKMGTGFQTTSTTDGCSYGIVTGNMSKHGFDQGISVWNSQYITVVGNKCDDAGWGGIVFTHCNDSTASANVCINQSFNPPFDLNEGTGLALEGCVRCVAQGNICSGNNSNGMRLTLSPMFGGAALSVTTSGSLSAGATSITLTAANSNFINGASFTIIDPNNNMIRETIYCTGGSNPYTISPGLRNAYASGASIFARYGEDCLITGNVCSLQALGAGIKADQQLNLRVFSNDCSKNGFLNGAFVDTLGTYGIHLHSFCQGAVVEANTCAFNAQEGMVIDNNNRAVVVQANSCNNNGISGTNQKMGIKLYGPVDTAVIGNECNFNTHTGIYMQAGSVNPAHTSLIGNTCLYNNTSGIWLDNVGSTILVENNKIAYNNDVGIKVTGYADCTFAENECYNQQGQEGIRFDDNGTNYCLRNKVVNNHLFDDQGSPTQSYGFRELNHTANSDVRGNSGTGNVNGLLSLLSPRLVKDNVGYNPIGQVTAPTFPATTVAATNTTGADVTAYIANGTAAITVVQVAGAGGTYVTTGLQIAASGWGVVRIPAGGSVKFTYASGTPSWVWMGD